MKNLENRDLKQLLKELNNLKAKVSDLEKYKAENLLKNELCEEKWKSLKENSLNILFNTKLQIWAFDGEFYTYLSKEWYNYTGQDPSLPLTIDRWTEIVHPDDLDNAVKIWFKHWETKTEHENYFRLKRKDGVYRYFHCQARPVFNEDGQFKHFQGFNIDITERIKAEKELRKSENNLQNFVENAHGFAVYSITLSDNEPYGVHTNFASPSIIDILGIDDPQDNRSWFEQIHSDDIDRVTKSHHFSRKTGNFFDETFRINHPKKKEVRCIHALSSAVKNKKGTITHFNGLLVDITEHKKAEKIQKEYVQFLEGLSQIDKVIQQSMNPDIMLHEVIETVFRLFNSDRAWLLYPCDLNASTFRIPYESCRAEFPGGKNLKLDILNTPSMQSDMKLALSNKGPITCGPGNEYKTSKDTCKKFNVQSQMFMSIYPKSGSPWVIGLHQCSYARIWTKPEQRLFNEIGRRIADGISNLLVFRNLQKSEEKYRTIVTNIPDVIWTASSEGTTKYISSNIEKFLGYTREEIYNSGERIWPGRIHPDDIEKVISVFKLLFEENKMYDIEFRIQRKDGKWIWAQERSIKTYEKDGLRYADGIFSDISERKKAQIKLKESDERFKRISLNANEVIFRIDVQKSTFELITDNIVKILGYKAQDFINNPALFQRLLHKRDVKRIESVWNSMLKKGVSKQFECRRFHKSGKIVWLHQNNVIVKDDSGKIIAIEGSLSDISDRKHGEQIQKVLYNISNAAIITDNLKTLIEIIKKELGTIIDTTNFYMALYDEKTHEFSLPYHTDQFDKLTTFPAGKTLTAYVVRNQQSLLATKEVKYKLVESGEIELFGADSEVWLGVPLKIEGKVTGVFAVQSYTDKNAFNESDLKMLEFVSDHISISIERKIAEENLFLALEKAKESDRLKTAFLHNLSHEIRTPMNSILGFSDLLIEPGLTGEEKNKYIDLIMHSSKRLLNTVKDLLDISLIESNQVKVYYSNIGLKVLLQDIFNQLKPETDEKGLSFIQINTLNPPYDIIITDKEKIYTILLNLIKNAIKYSHHGSIVFGYYLKKADKIGNNNSELMFFVKDNGIGIPKDRFNAIFERFVQADIEDKKVYEGSGLGLSIAKAYVELLGGKIWVNSELGNGSQFYFTIPYNTSKNNNIDINKRSFLIRERPMEKPKKLKVLIVEDELEIDFFLTKVVENISKEILHANTGNEAIKICHANMDIDLILIDIKLHDMNGYETTKQIRKFNKNVVIIAQTAYALIENHDKAIEAGCNDYITKPIIKDELLEIIYKHTKDR